MISKNSLQVLYDIEKNNFTSELQSVTDRKSVVPGLRHGRQGRSICPLWISFGAAA